MTRNEKVVVIYIELRIIEAALTVASETVNLAVLVCEDFADVHIRVDREQSPLVVILATEINFSVDVLHGLDLSYSVALFEDAARRVDQRDRVRLLAVVVISDSDEDVIAAHDDLVDIVSNNIARADSAINDRAGLGVELEHSPTSFRTTINEDRVIFVFVLRDFRDRLDALVFEISAD